MVSIDARSASSSTRGRSPSRSSAEIAAPAAGTSENTPSTVAAAVGSGNSLTVSSVITPNVPSVPTKPATRSYAVTPLAVRRPQRSTSPPISATSRPSTYSRVTPYLNARGPPALVDALPPIEQNSSDAGSGG